MLCTCWAPPEPAGATLTTVGGVRARSNGLVGVTASVRDEKVNSSVVKQICSYGM